MFLDRTQELQWLAQRYQSEQAEFIVMMGNVELKSQGMAGE